MSIYHIPLDQLLIDWGEDSGRKLPGASFQEWYQLWWWDYDEVDRLYLDFDICGGE